jgi:hypothetical protein
MEKHYCSLCHSVIVKKAGDACSKCWGELLPSKKKTKKEKPKRTPKKAVTKLRLKPGSDAKRLLLFLKGAQGATKIDVMAKKLGLSERALTKILTTSLSKAVVLTSNGYRLKPSYMRDDLNRTVGAILTGADILTQLEMM